MLRLLTARGPWATLWANLGPFAPVDVAFRLAISPIPLPSAPLQLAQLGAGRWGRNIIRTVAEQAGVALKWVADPNPEAEGWSALPKGTRPEVCRGEDVDFRGIDGVVIATPPASHGTLATRALRAGCHVLVEKPMTLEPQAGRQILAEAKGQGLVAMVGHVTLYHPAIERIVAGVKRGEIGELRMVRSERTSRGRGDGEGDLWAMSPHDLAQLITLDPSGLSWMERGRIERGGNRGAEVLWGSLASGVRFEVIASRRSEEKRRRLSVFGSHGSYFFDEAGGSLWLRRPQTQQQRAQLDFALQKELTTSGELPLTRQLQHFQQCIERRQAPRSDFQQGLRVVEALHHAHQLPLSPVPPNLVALLGQRSGRPDPRRERQGDQLPR